MRIEIDPAALDDPSAQAHIDALVDRLGVHDVTVTDFDALPGSRWGQRNPKRVSDLQDSVAGPPHHRPAAGPGIAVTHLLHIQPATMSSSLDHGTGTSRSNNSAILCDAWRIRTSHC